MIWINEEIIEVDAVELFSYIRNLPEAVDDEFASYNSKTSKLAACGSEWGSLLAKHIWVLVTELCRNAEIIVCEYPEKDKQHRNWIVLKKHIGSLEKLGLKIKDCKIAIWDADTEDLQVAKERWQSLKNGESLFLLPHIQNELSDYAEEERAFRKVAFKEMATLNKKYKH